MNVSRVRQLLLAPLALAAFVLGFAATPASGGQSVHPLVGIADENLPMFSDPRFSRSHPPGSLLRLLGRALAAYHDTTAQHPDQLASRCEADGLTPLITFDHSDLHGRVAQLPTVASSARRFSRSANAGRGQGLRDLERGQLLR